jgi:hypothetical protein
MLILRRSRRVIKDGITNRNNIVKTLVFSIKENGIRLILLRKACKSVLKFAVMMFIYDDRPEPFSICTFVLLFSPYATSSTISFFTAL